MALSLSIDQDKFTGWEKMPFARFSSEPQKPTNPEQSPQPKQNANLESGNLVRQNGNETHSTSQSYLLFSSKSSIVILLHEFSFHIFLEDVNVSRNISDFKQIYKEEIKGEIIWKDKVCFASGALA